MVSWRTCSVLVGGNTATRVRKVSEAAASSSCGLYVTQSPTTRATIISIGLPILLISLKSAGASSRSARDSSKYE